MRYLLILVVLLAGCHPKKELPPMTYLHLQEAMCKEYGGLKKHRRWNYQINSLWISEDIEIECNDRSVITRSWTYYK